MWIKINSLIVLLLFVVFPFTNTNALPAEFPAAQSSGCSNSDRDTSRPSLYWTDPVMSSSDVSYLQNQLLRLGYSLPVYGADGYFGEETDVAVRDFQSRNGLDVDGMVGPITWACFIFHFFFWRDKQAP